MEYSEFSKLYIEKIDFFINNYFNQKTEDSNLPYQGQLYSDIYEFCSREGKRVRPLLVLIGYLGYNKRRRKIDDIVKLASVVELMHSMLLIQDDIIDKAETVLSK